MMPSACQKMSWLCVVLTSGRTNEAHTLFEHFSQHQPHLMSLEFYNSYLELAVQQRDLKTALHFFLLMQQRGVGAVHIFSLAFFLVLIVFDFC
jgi:hypothetical protein